jgi:SAM-dependent methyltransferase
LFLGISKKMIDMSPELLESEGIFVSKRLLKDQPKSDDQLGRLIALARHAGWRRALQTIYGDGPFVDYIVDESRLSLMPVLPLEPSSSILEIGPGYGQMTVALSKRVASLDAVEADLGQARFCKIRTDQEGCRNVRIVAAGEAGNIPFGDCSFDGVVMNLVLEWCGIRETERSHEDVQKQYLSEIRRVLVPGGFFFVSTKNRYSLRLLTGGRDEHMSNMPFGSALPRWLGYLITSGRRQAGYLHSYSELLRMLKLAGFNEIAGFWAAPDMRWPKKYVSYDSDLSVIRDKQLTGLMPIRSRLAMRAVPTRLLKYVAPGLTFLARKPRNA